MYAQWEACEKIMKSLVRCLAFWRLSWPVCSGFMGSVADVETETVSRILILYWYGQSCQKTTL